jgi:CRISPR-associated protein Csy1
MVTQTPNPTEVAALRGLIDGFIQERLHLKLAEIKKDDAASDLKKLDLLKKYEKSTWLSKASTRVKNLQIATHTLKGIHPDAKGSSLNLPIPSCSVAHLIGTHTLNGVVKDDVVGNAADLDVFKFLKLEHNGLSLLTRLSQQDGATLQALNADGKEAAQWAQAFAGIVEGKGGAASHTLAKQMYFPLADDSYHLLAPLFPTALVHSVHFHLQEERFSDKAKAARTARRAKEPHAHGYCDYPNMVVRNMGGSKPQNISQLNSERGGANHLLASVPPVWKDQGMQPPLRVASVFDKRGVVGRDRTVRFIAKALRPFLKSVVDVDNNMHIREKRAELVQAIIDRVLDIATEVQCLRSGWSADPACLLSWAQKQWLDVDAVEAAQEALAAEVASNTPVATEWRERVAEDFARWLNATISTDKTPMGDDGYVKWKHTFLEVLP